MFDAVSLQDAENLKELVRLIAVSLVDNEDAVSVEAREMPTAVVLVLKINPKDIGHFKGNKGDVEHAITNIISAVGARLGHRFRLEILD